MLQISQAWHARLCIRRATASAVRPMDKHDIYVFNTGPFWEVRVAWASARPRRYLSPMHHWQDRNSHVRMRAKS